MNHLENFNFKIKIDLSIGKVLNFLGHLKKIKNTPKKGIDIFNFGFSIKAAYMMKKIGMLLKLAQVNLIL